MIILSGIQVRDELKKKLLEKFASLAVLPELAIIQIGENKESDIYIKQKKKFGAELGVIVNHKILKDDVREDEIIDTIKLFNDDKKIGGIIVQLPIPKQMDSQKILDSIDTKKDVDGLGAGQIGLLYTGNKNAIMPATARGIISLLDFYDIDLDSKHIVVIGRSNLVGRPVAQACLNKNATVTICHSHTKNISEITKKADILIVACGIPHFINSTHVHEGQVIIDVGIHKTEGGICGDVDFEDVKDIVEAVSPVPGGVGPLTVLSLFQNLVDSVGK